MEEKWVQYGGAMWASHPTNVYRKYTVGRTGSSAPTEHHKNLVRGMAGRRGRRPLRGITGTRCTVWRWAAKKGSHPFG